MTTIKATCPMCGDVDRPADVRLTVAEAARLGHLHVQVLSCRDLIERRRTTGCGLLSSAGVLIDNVPDEVLEPSRWPPITYDDVLDLALWLDPRHHRSRIWWTMTGRTTARRGESVVVCTHVLELPRVGTDHPHPARGAALRRKTSARRGSRPGAFVADLQAETKALAEPADADAQAPRRPGPSTPPRRPPIPA